jgi:hypothetical protein
VSGSSSLADAKALRHTRRKFLIASGKSLFKAAAPLRTHLLVSETSFTDFLLNGSREIALSYGENSWALAYWNVTARGFIDATNEAMNGEYSTAAVAGILAAIKLGKVKEFAGGAYGKLKSVAEWERHHMPADSISPLSRARGPAIQMEQADHALTMSYGNSAAAQAYRQEIQQLIQQGRWREAMAREIRDVRRIAGSKYNQAVQEMLEYMRSTGLLD